MSGIIVAPSQSIAFASCPILPLVFYVYWNDRRLTQIPPRALYFPQKRHTAVDVTVYAEAKEGGPDRPQHPGSRAVAHRKIVLDRLSK